MEYTRHQRIHPWLAALAVLFTCGSAYAENWVEYYRTGTPRSHEVGKMDMSDVVWDLNEVDLDSVKRDKTLVRYRVRTRYAEGGPGGVDEMQADCSDGRRGQLPDPRMRSTYKGTLGGEEVRAVCSAAPGNQ
jgi:hypothetical protein